MNESVTVNPNQNLERRRAWLWPSIVIGILSVHTLGCLIVVFIATSDPSHAVVRNYHAKAIAWDKYQAQQRAGEALGWTPRIEAALSADMLGQRTVRISIRDADDKPLTDATVTLNAYHHARANQITEAKLEEAAPGEYVVTMDMRRSGFWTFDVKIQRSDELFRYTADLQVGPLSGSPR